MERRDLLRAGATAGVAVGAGALLWLLWPKGQVPNGNGYTGTATPGQATPTVRPGPTVAGPVAPLSQPRAGHSAIVLRNGLLLVAGGLGPERGYLSSTELFDPAANRWTAGGPLSRARAGHTATLLSDGTVLVAGGQDSDTTYLASAELFDPETRRWTSVEPMSSTRSDHTATRLANGRVLVVGGQNRGPVARHSRGLRSGDQALGPGRAPGRGTGQPRRGAPPGRKSARRRRVGHHPPA